MGAQPGTPPHDQRDNQLLTRGVTLTLTEVQFHSRDIVVFDASTTRERLDAPFGISRGITLSIGAQYDFQRSIVRGQTANRRVLAINGRRRVKARQARAASKVSYTHEFNGSNTGQGNESFSGYPAVPTPTDV